MNKYWHILLSIGMITIAVACGEDQPATETSPDQNEPQEEINTPADRPSGNDFTPIEIGEEGSRVVEGERAFAIELFRRIWEVVHIDNTVLSPLSVYELLSIAAEGSSDEVRGSLEKLLGGEVDKILKYEKILNGSLPCIDKESECIVSNSIWKAPEILFYPSFSQVVDNHDVSVMDCNPEGIAGMERINQWVNNSTKGLIPKFLDTPIAGVGGWALLNAVYFSGRWKDEFSVKCTYSDNFSGNNGNKYRMEFMRGDRLLSYYCSEEITIARLYYGNRNFALTFYMPEGDFNQFISGFSSSKVAELNKKLTEGYISLTFPKFKCEGDFNLIQQIKDMANIGLRLDKMFAEKSSALQLILHKSTIEVDEEGTKASAASMGMEITMGGSTPPLEAHIIIDHPFFYMIEEMSTGTIIFTGAVVKSDMMVRS